MKIINIKRHAGFLFCSLILLSVCLQSCRNGQDDYFDESSSARMAGTISQARQILRNSEYGWEFEYYPDRELSFGGLVYTVKFDSLTATVSCSLIPDSTVTSYYRLTNDNGPVLTFDTYNPLLHFFATPNVNEYQAKDGDFEFVISQMSDDEIVLYGKRTHNTMYLRRLQYPADDYAARTIAVSDNFVTSVHGAIGGVTFDGQCDLNSKSICFLQGRDTLATAHFTFTDRGIRFYRPIEIGGRRLQSFAYAADTHSLTCLDEGQQDIVLEGTPHGSDYLPFSQCAGNYELTYFRGQLSASVKLVANRIDGTFQLQGLSSQYELTLNYDFNTGELTLSPQMVGILDGRAVYFLAMDLDDDGNSRNIWVSAECAMKLVWNRNKTYSSFSFQPANPDKYPCNSAVLMQLYYDDDGLLTGAILHNADWLTNETAMFPFLSSLTKAH